MRDLKLAGSLWGTRMVARTAAAFGDLVAELDRPSRQQDPYPLYDEIRERGPFYHSRLGFYATASHEVVSALVRHPDASSAVLGAAGGGATSIAAFPDHVLHPIRDSIIGMDAPDHTRLRRLVSGAFTPRALAARREATTRIARDLLRQLPVGEEFDLVENFAVPFPTLVMADLLGVPDPDVPKLAKWGAILGEAADGVRSVGQAADVTKVLEEVEDFFGHLLDFRCHTPGRGLVGWLVGEGAAGDVVKSRRELLGLVELLLFAGFETLKNFIGTSVLALVRNPEQLALLRADPSLATAAVDEALRYDAPAQSTLRTVRRDVSMFGHHIKANTPILVLFGGANRDPAVFPSPGRFDITRRNSGDHVAFAAGPHFCLGAALARMEGEIMLRSVFSHFGSLELAGDVEWYNSFVLRGARRMPVIGR